MGKRKDHQRRGDLSSSSSSSTSWSSSSSEAKRPRSRDYQNGETSRPNDGTLTLFELKETIQQDKVSTEAKFNRKIRRLQKKVKTNEKDIRTLKKHIRILEKGHEDLKSRIQEMQKGGCAEVAHDKASPSQRSQLSQSTRFRLAIENSVSGTIYKNDTVETEDGGGRIKVIMHDGDNPITPDHPLASVKVELVVIEGRFNDKRDSWSKEEFEKSIIKPREGMTRLVKNGSFHLIGGSCDHQGTIIMDNSQKKEVKLGVMIAVRRQERVLEGVSNPFKVQEVKTKRSQKNGKQPSLPIPTRMLVQPTSSYSTQHDQGPVRKVCLQNLPPPLQNLGQTQNGNCQNFRQEILVQMLGQSTSTNPIQHGQVHTSPPSNDLQAAGQAQNNNRQNFHQEMLALMLGQSTSTNTMQQGQGSVSPVSQHSSPAPVSQDVLHTSVYQHLPAHGQYQDTSFPSGSSELAYQNPSAELWLNDNEVDVPVDDFGHHDMGLVATSSLYQYQWEKDTGVATFMHSMPASSFPQSAAHGLAHREGLVLVPTESVVRVLNLATRRVLTLPSSLSGAVTYTNCFRHYAFGLGQDPSSGAYKVVRFFDRAERDVTSVTGYGYASRAEVFTIGGVDMCWRETTAQPPASGGARLENL